MSSREGDAPAALLAQAVGLDMHDWWTSTAAGYFAHVSKAAKTLEAVQVFAPEQVNRLAKLKKAEFASEAERLVAETRWLPVMFRGVEEPVTEVPVVSAVEAEDTTAVADHEDVHAVA